MKVMAMQGDTIDSICWRYYGRTDDMVEQVLLANQGLAFQPLELPLGTLLELPDAIFEQPKQTIQLWD